MSVLVLLIVGTVTPSTAITPADTRVIVVSLACQSSIDQTPRAVDVLAVIPATGNPVQFVRVPDDGVPRTGVVRVGEERVLFSSVSVDDIVGIFTFPLLILPVPLGLIFMSMFVSPPVASKIGQFPVDALLIVNSLTAPVTEVSGNLISSLLDQSLIRLLVEPSKVIHPLIISASDVVLLNQLCPDALRTIVLSVSTHVIIPVSQTITVEF